MGSGTLFTAIISDTTPASDVVLSLMDAGVQVLCVTCIDTIRQLSTKEVIGSFTIDISHHPNHLLVEIEQLLKLYPQDIPLHIISHTQPAPISLPDKAKQYSWPYDKQRLIEALKNELNAKYAHAQPSSELISSESPLYTEFKGVSNAIQTVRAAIYKAAAVDSNILITGETGTGKGRVAQIIHQLSRRNMQKFVQVNCAAIPDTLLESELFGHKKGAFTGADHNRSGKLRYANKGTLFLDEIGDMPLASQAKILHAIESQSVQPVGEETTTAVDVRFVAATNQDLDNLIKRGQFRNDLFYRLDVVHIHLPPLQERREDIHCITQHFIEVLNRKFKRNIKCLSQSAFIALTDYDWPGNIRELYNAIEVAFVNQAQHEIDAEHLPLHICNARTSTTLPDNELRQLISALNSTQWNKTKAAERLKWSRMTLYRKMKKYNVG